MVPGNHQIKCSLARVCVVLYTYLELHKIPCLYQMVESHVAKKMAFDTNLRHTHASVIMCAAQNFLTSRAVIGSLVVYHSCWRASFLAFCLGGRPAIYYIHTLYIIYILYLYIRLYTYLACRPQCQQPARQQLCSMRVEPANTHEARNV